MCKKYLCLLIAVLTLAGCSTSTAPLPMPTQPLPENLTRLCPPIEPRQGDSWDDLGAAYIALAGQYGDCAARHRGLVEAVQPGG